MDVDAAENCNYGIYMFSDHFLFQIAKDEDISSLKQIV